ncbi:MAG: DUF1572 family protein [Elusimicrobia bacterium]|nr:DUF1572 family protein [Elusimicrobiota bacterium]
MFIVADAQFNSIAILMKHLAGNMRSRATDFLTTDGEKPDRNRDTEFVIDAEDTQDSLQARWERGWGILFDSLESLKPEDLGKTVFIRGEPYSVIRALNRQLAHCAYHVGQIVLLSTSLTGTTWQSLSIPRGKSEEFNAEMRRKWEARSLSEN